jgi:hypothetical protein
MFHTHIPGVASPAPQLPIPSQSHAPHLETESHPRTRPWLPMDEALAIQFYHAFDQSVELTVQ